MSVLFHPSLGRFSAPDEVAGSATDSDSNTRGLYYGRRAESDRHDRVTRRERSEAEVGNPNSRRYRRYLNDTFSESEFTDTEDFDSDEDRPIVRFEWKQTFVTACREGFFNENLPQQAVPLPDESLERRERRRRLPRMPRRRAGELTAEEKEKMQHDEEEAEKEDQVVALAKKYHHRHSRATGETKEEMIRRLRAAKFGSSKSDAAATAVAGSSPPGVIPSALTHSDSDETVGGATVKVEMSAGSSTPVIYSRDQSRDQSRDPSEVRSFAGPGQEYAQHLFLQIEHSIRRTLRKRVTDSDFVFLTELEDLLIAYKRGLHNDHQLYSTFDVQPHDIHARDVTQTGGKHEDDDDHDTEVTSDDEVLVDLKSSNSKNKILHAPAQRRYAIGEEPLQLVFRSSFERLLAHGLIQFHRLLGESYQNSTNTLRITEIRIPKRGVMLHRAKLVPYLKKQIQKAQK